MPEIVDLNSSQSTQMTTSADGQLRARNELWEMQKTCPIPEPERERSPGLFIRASVWARLLAVHDIYKRIVHLPGVIMDFGTWRGQNAVLCENFRAIYEPLNKQRRVVCFDSFEGYTGTSTMDKAEKSSANHQEKTYSTGVAYADYLTKLLALHESNNTLGHITGVHRVVKGDATKTVPDFMEKNKQTIVALAFFDMDLYEPTKVALQAIKPALVPGSVLVFFQLQRDELPGDAIALKEQLKGLRYTIEKAPTYNSMSVVTILG